MVRTREAIKREVIDSLYWDDRVDASEITVETSDGSIVLGGSVPTYRARYAAEADARFTRGVTDVRNNIVVRHPTTVSVPTDTEIHDDIRHGIDRDPDIDATDVIIEIDAGRVTLRGNVPTLWQKDLVDDVAFTSRGVVGVDNELAVVPTGDITDQVIADDIVAELERRVVVDPTDIEVTVASGYVTLNGAVPNWRARNAAYHAARNTTGVIDVIDNLTIRTTV